MNDNRSIKPPCFRKFHKLNHTFFSKRIKKNQLNLVTSSKSDTEIIKLIKRLWKRNSLEYTKDTTLISSNKGSLPLFKYRYALCNHHPCSYSTSGDEKNLLMYYKTDGHVRNHYKLLHSTTRNHHVSFTISKMNPSFKKRNNHSSECVHREVTKNKQKLLKSTKEKSFEDKGFGFSPAFLNNSLVKRIKNVTNIFDEFKPLNGKQKKENISISINPNSNNKDSNPITKNISTNKSLPVEDDISSIIKHSLITYMNENAAFFENNNKSTCVYESVGELDKEKSNTDTVIQTHDENMFVPKNGSRKVYLESLLECADIVNKNISGSFKHKVIEQVKHMKKHEILISEDFKNHLENKKHYSGNCNHKRSGFNHISGIRRNHMCSKKCFSSNTSNQNIKRNKHYKLSYKDICNEQKCRKTIMNIKKTGISCKKINHDIYCSYQMDTNLASTIIKTNINSTKNSFTTNNLIKLNLIKQMKNMKLLKSFSDSCVDLGKTSKFCCLKSRKNILNSSFHTFGHGTALMETSKNLRNNNNVISVKKLNFMKYNSKNCINDNKIYHNHVNDKHQLKSIGKSYSNDNIKKQGMLKSFSQGKNILEKCGDSDIVSKDNNCSKCEMSYIIYSCDGDKYIHKYEPKGVIDDNQYCFVDPDLYYCDSEPYLNNVLQSSGQCTPKLEVKSNYKILAHQQSTQSFNSDFKEKPNLREEVFESHTGEVDKMVFQKHKCSLKLGKRKNTGSRKDILKDEKIEKWIHTIKKSNSKKSNKSNTSLNQNHKKNSELSILSDFGLNCNTCISEISDLNEHRPQMATGTRDAATSAVQSDEDLRPSRSTIDKAIMCDNMNINEHKHIMQLHRNNIIIESSEVIQLNGNSASTYESKDIELSTTINPTTEKILKLEFYQGESQTKYVEWHCNELLNRSDHSIGTSHVEFGNISNDEFFGQVDKCHKSKELDKLEFKNIEYLSNEENNSAHSKNIWSSLKNGSQKVFSFFPPIGPLRTCFKKNIF